MSTAVELYYVDGDIGKTAEISEDGFYRYYLTRYWDDKLPLLTFIMLNPSTADANIDDPTIRRCMRFARDRGYGGIVVLNLFALRSPEPKDLKLAADPVGPLNDPYLIGVFQACKKNSYDVIAAWGVHGSYLRRDKRILELAGDVGLQLKCLGITKDGSPKHPLYIRADQEFIPYGS